ncbi:MAG: Hpt domain-containing protein [Gammaproteobacteria bacterium]
MTSLKKEQPNAAALAAPQLIIGNGIDAHVIEELVAEYTDVHAELEVLIAKLQNNPADTNALNSLFRQVHTIKGNSHFLGLEIISDFVHSLENVLDRLRKRDLLYEKILGEVILTCMDYIGDIYNRIRDQQPVEKLFIEKLQNNLNDLSHSAQLKVPLIAQQILQLFNDESTLVDADDSRWIRHSAEVNYPPEQLEDLKFYARLIEQTEQRSPFWKDRSQHILNIALAMNSEAGIKVDSAQLEAAVYMHDFYMAFLPQGLLHKGDRLSDAEFQSVKLHPQMAAALLADNMQWQEAATMIVQHHEREDGTGYPNRLTGKQTCDGAKILAIADAFESMTNCRADRSNRASAAHAIREINNNRGSQFSPFWVDTFNDVIRNITRKK